MNMAQRKTLYPGDLPLLQPALDYIRSYWDATSFYPSIRLIAKELQIKSLSQAQRIMRELERQEFILRSPSRHAYSLSLKTGDVTIPPAPARAKNSTTKNPALKLETAPGKGKRK